ncbi:EAL domain-containing protein [Jatrophihabitans telluris]|uniref:EAL domain-containing protein n=1 Tax=Jatrophihabitans telluris TaxID=2038343 RepID=A0ABY4QUB1_9ACTN|nr:EAL domain-containing protein [Jatrophihabitans telluris]UQX86894.1 EAL domain-containing protein [Jatrophihabitans telluris]
MLPEGRRLPDTVWARRHRWITRFALVQAVAIGIFGLLRHEPTGTAVLFVACSGVPAALGAYPHAGRRVRTMSVTVGLMLASAGLVELSGGVTEAHFHFFVMIGVVALYQDWLAFGVCILVVVLHHAVMGHIAPHSVFGNADQWQHPVRWALIHAGFVLAASATHLVAWKANEQQELSDPLTQLPNRTAFVETLNRRLADPGRVVSVLFIDIDNFKSINDSAGHHVGDVAIQHVAARMSSVLREGDLAARLGGDEFAVLVPGDAEQGAIVGRRISDALQSPVSMADRELFVQVSIGVADSTLAGSRDSADLLRDADLAMYLAKSCGKNQVATYTVGVDKVVRERAVLASDIRTALFKDELELYYQPLVSGADGRLSGVEALLRWHHPQRGLVPPIEFIQLAEETGAIRDIGAWVLRTAALQVSTWRRELPGCADLELSVNLSPLQLGEELVPEVLGALSAAGLAPGLLTLEVTESSLLADLESARTHLGALRSAGCRVAIDDFGTGYSSLSYLSRLPADQVKIDRSFIRDLDQYSGAVALVKGIIDMAAALGLDVLAEGVEEMTQQVILGELGCPRYQGYLFSRPIPVGEFGAFVARSAGATCAA